MSVDKVIQKCSSDSLYQESSRDIVHDGVLLNGSVEVLSHHSSEEYLDAVDVASSLDKLNNGSDINNYLERALPSKSFDSCTVSRPKILIPETKSAPVISVYSTQPALSQTQASYSESDIEDVSASELADLFSESLLGPYKHSNPIINKKAFTCLVKREVPGPYSENVDHSEMPVSNATPDESVESLEYPHSSTSESFVGTSGIKSKEKYKEFKKITVMNGPTDEVVDSLEDISSVSLDSDESSNLLGNVPLSEKPSQDSEYDEMEIAQYLITDTDSLHSGWKLDRRSSGQLFWRRDSSSLNGVDPRNRVKFRYDVEVCEFESRSSGAEDVPDDEDNAKVLDSEGESSTNVKEMESTAVKDRSETLSSSTTVIYAITIIAIILGVLYSWIVSRLDE